MIVINSAAYVVPEFRTEFGHIPACLIPLGNRKLLEYQVSNLRATHRDAIVVSLPDDYEPTADEWRLFAALSVEPAFVPVGLRLAEALLFVLNTVGRPNEPLHLLHGDTLIETIPGGTDLIAVAATQDDYSWEAELVAVDHELIWCGYFSFSSPKSFMRALALAQGDFVKAVRLYAEENLISRPVVVGWHDLGHVNTYFSSRSKITTQRVFNSLSIDDGLVWKSGNPAKKIAAEAEWFRALPAGLRRYIPQLIDAGMNANTGEAFYRLEYLPIPPLNEIFVHGKNPVFFWKRIFSLLETFLDAARSCSTEGAPTFDGLYADAVELYREKTFVRLEAFSRETGVDLDAATRYDGSEMPSIRIIASECIARTLELPMVPSIMHGDFCFSNILFDSRSAKIKVIDPRGLNQRGEMTIYGDQKYDFAKLCHSIIGLYDFIIAGRYELRRTSNGSLFLDFGIDERLKAIQRVFLEHEFVPGVTVKEIIPLTVLLFLSMLPLHADRVDRQEAMLVNALRLYAEHMNVTEQGFDVEVVDHLQ